MLQVKNLPQTTKQNQQQGQNYRSLILELKTRSEVEVINATPRQQLLLKETSAVFALQIR